LAQTKIPQEVVYGDFLGRMYSRKWDQRALGCVEKRFGVCADDFVLDVGCGPLARAEVYFGRKECKIVAVDVSVVTLLWAKKNLIRFGVQEQVELVAADAECLPFKRDCFDKILAMGLVVHLPTKRSVLSALKEMCRCLKRNGACYVDWCLNMYSVFGPLMAFVTRIGFIGKKDRIQILNFKGLEEIQSIFKQARLKILRTVYGSILWYGYYLFPTWFHKGIHKLLSAIHEFNNRYPRISFFPYSFDFVAGKDSFRRGQLK